MLLVRAIMRVGAEQNPHITRGGWAVGDAGIPTAEIELQVSMVNPWGHGTMALNTRPSTAVAVWARAAAVNCCIAAARSEPSQHIFKL
jgi:hypothetical protein